jgi:sugar lactone lactonase YvrE
VPRYVFEASLRSGDSIKKISAEDRFRSAVTGEVQPNNRMFVKPLDVTAKGGMVVVTDTFRKMGFIFNLRRQKLYRFGYLGNQGVLKKPLGVAINNNHQILVADVTARKVFVYDPFGVFQREIGSQEELDRPVDVAVSRDGKHIYVLDAGGVGSDRHRVVVYDQQGQQQFVIGQRGTGEGSFNLPTQIAVAPDETIYVLDRGNFRVQAFAPTGDFLRAWGRNGRNFGNLARPRGLAVDRDGYVYITDAAFRNVQVFKPDGQLLLAIGGEGMHDQPGQFALPAGVAVDELNHVYIVDQVFSKVDVLRRLSEQEISQVMASRSATSSR